uniref:Immunoglobulin-like and fibronectin type III domain-containing protein 1 n=1 Tax=Salvator merianae TaxID=96440 RepID=A0A8D0B9U3_SALMN
MAGDNPGSAVPGVTITQFVENIPKGCSTPDFVRKPITLTLQEGKNAIFRAVVKGEPKPEVLWKRNKKEIVDPQKYQISFSPGTDEFILQINKITADDADLYQCTAVNEYGEATCAAGLKIIQGRLVNQATDLKKEIQEFRKILKKTTPAPTPKKEVDMEQVWQLLLNADRKDYEKICMKYGIVDFRGMLRRLQEMKKESEDKQAQYVYNLTNLRHVRINEDKRSASFNLEMELKNPESRLYLYKDGRMINFGFDSDNVKHCLRQVGKKYNFIINDLQPEDAGVYQIKIEDVDIFSTELEAESIPVSFRYPLGEVRCHEQGNAVFQCTLFDPNFNAVWIHKDRQLEPSDKYEISVSNDGLSHRLVVRNAQPSDKGTYTIDLGTRSSSAWLEVERDKDDDLSSLGKDGQYRSGQDANRDGMAGSVGTGGLGGVGELYGKDGMAAGVGVEPHCRFNQGLFDVHALKGKSAILSCSLNNDLVEGIWFKDGFKITDLDGISVEKEGPVHRLVIDNVQDSHAGKYKFEAKGICTEASIFVKDPPNLDSALLEKLKKEPIVVKAGKNAMVKIPFEGRKPIRATWLKDDGELQDDARINTDCSDSFTRLSLSSTSRKDCGDYKVKLKNESGTAEAAFKLIVIDKPQPPMGPVEVVDSSTSGITIRWKPPKDDGGKPVQSYIIERQQVGRKTWVTLGETSGSSTVFTTNKVEHDKSYYFKIRAVNAEGTSEALESDAVMAATKVFPGPPAPPKIVSASKEVISLSWAAPHKTGNSRILGYRVEKCKKGSNSWTPVTDVPITERKYKVTDLKEGLLYEFRVAAINSAGVGEASAPSEAVFARDPMKPPDIVRDLKVVSTDYGSISLSWMKPESEEDRPVKGYIIEMRHCDILKWTQCNTLPIAATSYIVRGLKAREMYFLRVRAMNDGGLGNPVELDTCIKAAPPTVYPKVLVKDNVKSFMVVKAGNTIRVHIPFQASPTPEVHWLKNGLPLPAKATTTTRECLSQLIIPRAEFTDSGHYAIVLQTESGQKETFNVPESPGPIQLVEKVPDTVTLIWEPSPSEMRGSTLNYMVMRRDSYKGSWEVVADLIYTNKCTVANFMPGREYFFRVLAKNCMGISEPSETVQPWIIYRKKGKYEVRIPKFKGIDHSQPPRFLVALKPHVVTLGFDCHMSCAVTGYPAPQVTWYKDGKNISHDPTFFCKNDFGICSLVILGVTESDGGEYMVKAVNELGQAASKAVVTIKGKAFP